MPQLPAEKIAEIREKTNIVQLVGRSVRLEKKGRRFVGLCPFHSEKTPSFGVSEEKQLYHCFGCQAGGDAIDFVMRLEGLSFHEAIENLAGQAGVELPKADESPAEQRRRSHRESLFEVNEYAARVFERALAKDAPAQKYLTEERGLTHETIEAFRIGWAPNEWQTLTDLLPKKKMDPRLGIELGLMGQRARDGKPYDRLRARIVFPIAVERDAIAGFGARRADWVDPEGPKYLNSPESPIYDKSGILYGLSAHKNNIRRNREAFLVEGYLDVIALAQAGLPQAVAACGTALTKRHAQGLRRVTDRVLTMYDGDEAGREATRKAAILLLEEGLDVGVVSLPNGEDPDTLVRRQGANALKKLIDAAPSAVDFFLRQARAAHAGGGISGTTKAMEAVKPMILAIKDPLLRDVTLGAAARELGVQPGMLRRHLGGRAPAPQRSREGTRRQTRRAALPVLETELLKLLLEDPKPVVEAITDKQALEAFTHAALRAAIEHGIEAHQSGRPFDAPGAFEVIKATGELEEAALTELRAQIMSPLPNQSDVSECISRILEKHRKRKLQELRVRIERETDPDVATQLAVEAQQIMASSK